MGIHLTQTADGGEIEITDGVLTTDETLATPMYLALFGGNVEDDGRPGNPKAWWGNLTESENDAKMVSRTGHLLANLPLITSNLRRFEEAARLDLAYFVSEGFVSEIVAEASVEAPNTLRLVVTADDTSFEFRAETEGAS